jgi:TP901 family phage tail tape measure protein
MANQYTAKVTATLVRGSLQQAIEKESKNAKVQLSNITVDTSKLISEIQKSLGKADFKINLTGLGQQIGSQMGSAIQKQVESSLGSIKVKNVGTGNVKNLMASLGFDDKQIGAVTKKLEETMVTITKVKNSWTQNGGLKLTVNGVDELGRAVQIVQEFDKQTKVATTSAVSFTQSFASSTKAINTEAEALKKEKQEKEKAAKAAKEFADKVKQANKEALTLTKSNTLSNNIQAWMNKNTQAAKVFENELRDIQSRLSQNTSSGMLQRCAAEFNNIQARAKSANLTVKQFTSSLAGIGGKVGSFALQVAGIGTAYQAAMKAISTIKEGINTVINLDTALIDLRKTTTMSDTELAQFYRDANTEAKNLGVTTQEIIEQAAAWSRLGYSSAEEVKTMARLSSQFAQISPGMSTKEAQESLVSTMKAFGFETDEVLDGIMSKINILGNSFALSNKDLADALQVSSSSMNAANNSFEQTLALITAGTEITQDASRVGNGLRTISMRIRGLDEETGEFDETLGNVRNDISELTHGQVSIMEDEDTYKSTYDILKRISEIWDTLTDKEQAGLLEKLFGKNRAQIGAAILSNFQAAEDAMKKMQNSAGAADAEMSIIMDSLAYKSNRLKETWTGIWQTAIDRGDLGNIIDGLTKLSEGIGVLIEKFGVLGTILGAGALVLGIKNIAVFKELLTGVIVAGGKTDKLLTGISALPQTLAAIGKTLVSIAPAAASIATVILSIAAVADRFKEVNTTGMLGEGHTVEEYQANVEELERKLAQAQADYDNLAMYDDGSALYGAQDALSMAQIALQNAREELNNATASEEEAIAKTKEFEENVHKLSDGTLDKLINQEELTSDEAEDLANWMDECGYSAEDLAEHIDGLSSSMEESVSSSSAMSEAVIENIGNLTSLQDELGVTKSALEAYNKAMEGGEKGDAIGSIEEIYKGAMEDIAAGKLDTNRLHAAASLLFSPEQLASMNYDMQEVAKQLQSTFMKSLFDASSTDMSAGQRMIQQIMGNADMFKGIAEVTKNADGSMSFFYDSLSKLADAFGISEAAMAAFLDEFDAYGVEVMRSTEENNQLIAQYQQIEQVAGSTKEAVAQFITALREAGRDDVEISSILSDLSSAGVIAASVNELNGQIAETASNLQEVDNSDANPEVKVKDNATSTISYIKQQLASIPRSVTTTVNTNYTESGVKTSFSGSYGTGSSSASSKVSSKPTSNKPTRASGGRGTGTDTLVNELGPELISDNGVAFIANGGKPGFTYLSKDAVVFNADETKRIFGGSSSNIPSPAFAGGTSGSIRDRLISGLNIPAKALSFSGSYTKSGSSTTKTVTVSVKKCPRCGSSVAKGVQLCPYCGYNFVTGGYTTSGTKTYTTNTGSTKSNPTTTSVVQWSSPLADAISASGTPIGFSGNYTKTSSGIIINGPTSSKASPAGTYIAPQTIKYPSVVTSGSGSGYGGGGDSYGGSDIGGYTGSSDSVGSSNWQSQSDPEKVDWIAVAINRIQRAIADLQKVATSGFKKLSTRLTASRAEIQEVTHEIDIMNQGYERYLQEANKVGLSEDLAEKVRNGTIDINAYDESTRKLISEYQEWYEKALDCSSAVEDLNQQLAQLYTDEFANIQTDYENKLSLIEHDMEMINKDISMADSMGYLASAEHYQALMDTQRKDLEVMYSELQGLQSAFQEAMNSGAIDEQSEAWYDMNQQILSVKEAIADANIEMVNLRKTIRSIDWSHFDYAQEKFSQLSEEAEFLIDLMAHSKLFDENGQFNNKGSTTVGLIAMNYNAYMSQADAYAKELLEVQKELENDPYDTEVIERREQLLSLQRQSILAAESEKEAMKELVSQGMQAELDSLRDLIEAYNESIDGAQDLYDYQKKISEKSQDVATIQKQLSAYMGDTSEETRAKVQKLNEDLKKSQEDLSEAEREQSIADQRKLLDDVYSEYEELMNHRLDDIDGLMREMIDYTNENLMDIRQTVKDVSRAVGYTPTNEMMNSVSSSLANYDRVFEGITSTNIVLNHIYDNVYALARASGAVKSFATGGMVDYNGFAIVHGASNNEMMLNAADTQRYLQASKIMRSIPMLNASKAKNISMPGLGSGAGTVVDVGGISVAIDHVENYEDMLRQMRDDPKFEKLIEVITLDRAVGKSGFRKNMINF